MFFRGSNAIKFQTEGSGLGLFITKNVIEKNEGTIKIESEEGKGTKVEILLPRMEKETPEEKFKEFVETLPSKQKEKEFKKFIQKF